MPPPPPHTVWNDWAAWQFDQAVLYVGLTIENALQERVESGKGETYRSESRYTLEQLLDPDFQLPQPKRAQGATAAQSGDGLAWLMAMAGQKNSGVKAWKYVGPEQVA